MTQDAPCGEAIPGSRILRWRRSCLRPGRFTDRAERALEQWQQTSAAFATRHPRLGAALQQGAALAQWFRPVAHRLRWIALVVVILPLLAVAWVGHHVYFDRSGVPDLDAFVRFELPEIGEVYDSRGRVLIELAHEYRHRVSYDEVPLVMRRAILAAEDKRFFSHSGVDYTSLPRVVAKAVSHSLLAGWRKGELTLTPVFPQGGSTLTQQLVRGYLLPERTARENGNALYLDGWAPRLMSLVVGVPATNKLLRKLEEVRLSVWLEEEMQRRFATKELAKREIFARYASFIYLGHGRYGFAAGSDYYFGKPLAAYAHADAGKAALLAGMAKSPGDFAALPADPHARRRRDEVLALMARNGDITQTDLKRCLAEPIVTAPHGAAKTSAPGVVANVFEELRLYRDPRFGIDKLVTGRISIQATVDERVQTIVNQALEDGLGLYEKRHPRARGTTQGSVVVLRNRDAGVLAEAGGRQVYQGRFTSYSDLNRVSGSLRQPGSAFKPIVYFAAFEHGLDLDTTVPDEPIGVPLGNDSGIKWISNYDNSFKGPIPMRVALAESRNAVAIWLARHIGLSRVIETARELGIKSPLQPYITTALGASEVRLLELANVYRALASGIIAEAHVIENVVDRSGQLIYQASRPTREIRSDALVRIQEGLRGVIRLPQGTAHALDGAHFPIPVMGKTGTTSDFRDALFVGSTYGPDGITVAVRLGFDDNRPLGDRETGGRAALPIFAQVMLQVYRGKLVGAVPKFPKEIESHIDRYLETRADGVEVASSNPSPAEPAMGARLSPHPPNR